MFGRLGLGDLTSFGASGGGALGADDEAVTIRQVATVSAAKTNTTAIVGFSQVAAVGIETDPAAHYSAIATVTAGAIAAYTNASAISQIAAVTGAGFAGYTNAAAVSQIAAVGIERTVGYSWTNSEGSTWEAQCDLTGWDDGFRGDVDQLISDLKSGTVNATNTYSGFDLILLMDTPNSSDSLRYLNAPTLTATNVNSTAFTATEGFTGDGSADYINTNYNPSTDGSQFTQNSASHGCWQRTAATGGGYLYGFFSTSAEGIITNATPGGYGPNAGTTILNGTTARASLVGLTGINRSGSAARQIYFNGVSEGSDTASSTTLINKEVAILARKTATADQFSNAQISLWFAGRSFTANEWADIHAAFDTYRTAREAA